MSMLYFIYITHRWDYIFTTHNALERRYKIRKISSGDICFFVLRRGGISIFAKIKIFLFPVAWLTWPMWRHGGGKNCFHERVFTFDLFWHVACNKVITKTSFTFFIALYNIYVYFLHILYCHIQEVDLK